MQALSPNQNREFIKMVVEQLNEIPFTIKNALLMLNLNNPREQAFAGSCFLWLPTFDSPLNLSYKEKITLLMEFIQRFNITQDDYQKAIRDGQKK